MNEELNEKIAEWLELCYHEWEVVDDTTAFPYSRCRKCLKCGTQYPTDIDEYLLPKCADGEVYFDESLDACFKYIVPKLFTWNVGKNWELQNDLTIKENGFKASVDKGYIDPDKYDQIKPFEAVAETPALAFCKAVEKLIDA